MIKQKPIGKPWIGDMVSVSFELTYVCDKKCDYCYNPEKRCHGVSVDVKDRIWDKLMSIEKPLQVLLLGGETTLYEKSVNYFNEFVDKYKNDETKYITLFTHGNNNPEIYEKIKGGKSQAHIGMSYHADQTDYDLWMRNIRTLLENKVPVVVCMVITEDKSDWEEKRTVLEEIAEMGCMTDICFKVNNDNTQQVPNEAFDYFYEYFFRCIKIWELEFTGDEEMTIRRDFYFQHFPQGLNETKKMCKNRVFKITPDAGLFFECGLQPHVLDLNINLDRMEDFLYGCNAVCNQRCTGIASTLNEKYFFTNNIESIK